MNLEDGAFITEEVDGLFSIRIELESDLSLDGGYTFEDVQNGFELTQDMARELLLELQEFLDT